MLLLSSCVRETSPPPTSTSDATSCAPACEGRPCGPDGCGGSCGSCAGDLVCQMVSEGGVDCVPSGTCEPDCAGRACGPDSCGGTCGGCATGESCDKTGSCIPCDPTCADGSCGPDGCGGSCGACGDGEVCGGSLLCEAIGAPCGDLPPGGLCNGDVLTVCTSDALGSLDCAANDLVCSFHPEVDGFDCVPAACAPQCQGRLCGNDGCGGACGSCRASEACDDETGRCGESGCGDVDEAGRCNGDTLRFCNAGTRVTLDCTAQGKHCEFVANANDGLGRYDCVTR